MEKQKLVEYRIKAVELVDLSLTAPATALPEKEKVQFDINIQHQIDNANSCVLVFCAVAIKNNSRELTLGNIRSCCVFEILNMSSFFNDDNEAYDFPDVLVTVMNSITISTTRGMMASQFRGTFLSKAVLPIIDPNALTLEK